MSDKKTCPHCGAEVDAQRVVCPHCNRTLPAADVPPRAEAQQKQAIGTEPAERTPELAQQPQPPAEQRPGAQMPPEQRGQQPAEQPAIPSAAPGPPSAEREPPQPPTPQPPPPSGQRAHQPPYTAPAPPTDTSAPTPQWAQHGGPQQQWPQAGYPQPPPPRHSDPLALAGLILSIIGTLGGFCPCTGIFAPIGLILCAVSHSRQPNTVTWAGIIVGIFGTIVFLGVLALNLYFQMNPAVLHQWMREIFRQFPTPLGSPFQLP